MEIRALAAGDLDAVLAIQSACPEAAQWPRADYERASAAPPETAGDYRAWVATTRDGVTGFILMRRAADELEILNLAVKPPARRAGVATRLLDAALNAARDGGAHNVFLEVRESNAAAIAFYTRHGFARAGRRPDYYSAPREAALILKLELSTGGL